MVDKVDISSQSRPAGIEGRICMYTKIVRVENLQTNQIVVVVMLVIPRVTKERSSSNLLLYPSLGLYQIFAVVIFPIVYRPSSYSSPNC